MVGMHVLYSLMAFRPMFVVNLVLLHGGHVKNWRHQSYVVECGGRSRSIVQWERLFGQRKHTCGARLMCMDPANARGKVAGPRENTREVTASQTNGEVNLCLNYRSVWTGGSEGVMR